MKTAKVCGLLAGLPASCEGAVRALESIRRRAGLLCMEFNETKGCDELIRINPTGILNNTQLDTLRSIEQQAEEWLDTLTAIREVADLLADHYAIAPVASPEPEVSLL